MVYNYNPFSIMNLPAFWQGAIAARTDTVSKQFSNLHKLLSIAERGECVINSDEFAEWLGYHIRE